MADLQTFKSYSTPNLTGINITFMNSESFLKTSNRTDLLFTATFTSYQINYDFVGVTS